MEIIDIIGFFILIILTTIFILRFRAQAPPPADAGMEYSLKFKSKPAMDCVLDRLPCVVDSQCRDYCRRPIGRNIFRCDLGFCTPSTALTSTLEEVCDEAKGLLSVVLATDFVVDQACISLVREVFEDNGDKKKFICDGGELDVDFKVRALAISDCACPNDKTKLIYDQGPLVSKTPLCVPKKSSALYERIYQS